MTGFFTREIRENQRRVGFEIITMHGDQGVLAHVNLKSRVRVGRYGVNLEDLERIAVPAMIPTKPDEIVIIDEIGKMECFSPLFRETLERTLDSAHHVIGSIAKKGDRFIERIKNRGGCDAHYRYRAQQGRIGQPCAGNHRLTVNPCELVTGKRG